MADAVNFAVGQLQSEPGQFRRIVLLLGQAQDQGRTAAPEEVLRTLGGAGTAVYSLTFSGPKKSGKPTKSRVHGKSASPNPLRSALDELQQHTAAELAAYTGGGHATFTDRRDFDEAFKAFAADIRNRYMLEFQPAEHESGFHQLAIKVRKGLSATARGGYWFDPPRGDP